MTVKSMMRLGVLIGLTLGSIPSRAEGRITASSLWAGKLLDIAVTEAQAEYNADPESTAAAYTFTNAYYASYYNRLAEKTSRDVFFTEDQAFIFNNEAARQALPGLIALGDAYSRYAEEYAFRAYQGALQQYAETGTGHAYFALYYSYNGWVYQFYANHYGW